MQWNFKMSNSLLVIRYCLFVVSSLLFFQTSFAQLDNTFLRDEISLKEKDSSTVGLNIGSFNYMRNTEYFNNIELGRTLFGYQFHPSLFYQPTGNVKLQAGAFLQSNFGETNPYLNVIPTFTLKVRNNNFSFLFGTLEGSISHRLIEPLYNIEYAITRKIENGFQVKYDSPKQFFDLWIDWQKFIDRGSPYKEALTAGFSNLTTLFGSASGFKIKVPVQATIHHRGGQIDTDSSNMIVQLNAAAGLRLSQEFKTGIISEVRFDGYYSVYNESTNSGYFLYRNGNGIYVNALVESKIADLMISYWAGNKFISPTGSYIYQSQSIDKPAHYENNRELVFVRLMKEQLLFDDLYLTARIEPVYDMRNKILDYSYSVYLTYKKDITFKRIK